MITATHTINEMRAAGLAALFRFSQTTLAMPAATSAILARNSEEPAAPGKRREDVEASHSKAQHVLILTFFGKVGGITRSERADTDLTGQTRKYTGLMNRTSSYNLTEGVPNGEYRMKDGKIYKNIVK
jgi:hypothetical protein